MSRFIIEKSLFTDPGEKLKKQSQRKDMGKKEGKKKEKVKGNGKGCFFFPLLVVVTEF